MNGFGIQRTSRIYAQGVLALLIWIICRAGIRRGSQFVDDVSCLISPARTLPDKGSCAL
jgi:hypothetical protein